MSEAEEKKARAQKDSEELKDKVGMDMKEKIKSTNNWRENLRTVCSVVQIGAVIVMQVAIPLATGAAACIVQ